MKHVGAFEGKNNFGKLLDGAYAGEELVIARHCKPVAILFGTTQPKPQQIELARAAAKRIRAPAAKRKTRPFVSEEWKAYRDQGRMRAWFWMAP